MTAGHREQPGVRRFVWWTDAELAVVDSHVRALVGGRHRSVAAAVEACRRELASLPSSSRGGGVGKAGRAWNTVYRMFLMRRRKLDAYEYHGAWAREELAVLNRALRGLKAGRYSDVQTAADASMEELA